MRVVVLVGKAAKLGVTVIGVASSLTIERGYRRAWVSLNPKTSGNKVQLSSLDNGTLSIESWLVPVLHV